MSKGLCGVLLHTRLNYNRKKEGEKKREKERRIQERNIKMVCI